MRLITSLCRPSRRSAPVESPKYRGRSHALTPEDDVVDCRGRAARHHALPSDARDREASVQDGRHGIDMRRRMRARSAPRDDGASARAAQRVISSSSWAFAGGLCRSRKTPWSGESPGRPAAIDGISPANLSSMKVLAGSAPGGCAINHIAFSLAPAHADAPAFHQGVPDVPALGELVVDEIDVLL